MATYVYVTRDQWQIWRCKKSVAIVRAKLLAGRVPFMLLKDGAPASKPILLSGLDFIDDLVNVLSSQSKPSYVEGR